MDAKELRIGNLIGFKNNSEYICNVYLIMSDEIGVVVNDVADGDSADEFIPLKLTDEWLLRFGFKNLGNSHFLSFTHNNFPIGIKKTPNKYCYFISGEDKYLIYVHQLQNLYFALTGQELTYKP